MTYQMRIGLCCAGLPHFDARTTPDDAVRHIVSIVDTRRRPGRVTITEQALWVRRHQRTTGK